MLTVRFHFCCFFFVILVKRCLILFFPNNRIPEVGTLVSPKFPDTMLFEESDKFYGAEGFRYEPVVPMKHWKLSYDGILKYVQNEKCHL